MSNIEQEADITDLSEDEIKINHNERLNNYKITIAICIIYSLIAFILIFLGYFTSWGNKYLFGDIIAFTITYSIGSIFIVLYLSNLIYNFKFKKIPKEVFDKDMCPDYWELKVADEVNSDEPYLSSNLNSTLFKYKCVKNSALFNNKDIINSYPDKNFRLSKNNNDLYINLDASNNTSGISIENDADKYKNFQKYATYMSGYNYNDDNTITKNNDNLSLRKETNEENDNIPPLNCSKVFPVYLSAMDNQNYNSDKKEPMNRYRCAYSKACGVSWTDAGCY